MCGSFETEVCVSDSRSTPIYGVNHKTVITVTMWPFFTEGGYSCKRAQKNRTEKNRDLGHLRRTSKLKVECVTKDV